MGKKEVLIIGCGNIGALYDYKKEGIRTHLKAFTSNSFFSTTIYDQNQSLCEELASHYKVSCLGNLNNEELKKFDVIVISTPTHTHHELLSRALQLQTPVIICEKPISDNTEQLNDLEKLKSESSSKVIVNYFRRFHPSFHLLKKEIAVYKEQLSNIQVTYQRGFSNNASHALDLLNFLFYEDSLAEISTGSHSFDEFKTDPTITLTGKIFNVPIVIHGLQNVKFSFFEIKLGFQNSLISISKNGETITFYSNGGSMEAGFYYHLQQVPTQFDGMNAIQDPMKYVVETVARYFEDPQLEDNFISSLHLNKQLLKITGELCHN